MTEVTTIMNSSDAKYLLQIVFVCPSHPQCVKTFGLVNLLSLIHTLWHEYAEV